MEYVQSVIRVACIVVAAVGAFWSGLFWHLSAVMQLKALSMPATSTPDMVQKVLTASAYDNLWAAWGAMAAGVAVFLLLLFKDSDTAG